MVNANVDALTKLITECRAQVTHDETGPLVDPIVAGMIADWLVSRPTPVLVISDAVLTDEALDKAKLLDSEFGMVRTTGDEGQRVRSTLARLARGEEGE